MPEALARADYDYTVSEEAPPRRRARPRAADRIEPLVSRAPQMIETGRAARTSRARGIAVTLLRHPLRTLVSLACGVIAISFVVNILFMQSGPHPAPLFAGAEPKREPVQEARASVAPAETARVETAGGESAPIVRDVAKPVPSAANHAPRSAPPSIVAPPPARPAEAQKQAVKQPEFDPIAQFLRGVAPATTGSTNVAAEARRVTAAQRALVRLGHPVDIDGLYGPGTRAAIQKFERDNKLPVTGELNPRTIKALSARASIPIP